MCCVRARATAAALGGRIVHDWIAHVLLATTANRASIAAAHAVMDELARRTTTLSRFPPLTSTRLKLFDLALARAPDQEGVFRREIAGDCTEIVISRHHDCCHYTHALHTHTHATA